MLIHELLFICSGLESSCPFSSCAVCPQQQVSPQVIRVGSSSGPAQMQHLLSTSEGWGDGTEGSPRVLGNSAQHSEGSVKGKSWCQANLKENYKH